MSKDKGNATPEEKVAASERNRRHELEAAGTAGGAVVGAIVGAIAGPVGIAAGAVIGAAVGGLASVETEQVDHTKAEHYKDLDAIGTDTDRERANLAEDAAVADLAEPHETVAELQAELAKPESKSK